MVRRGGRIMVKDVVPDAVGDGDHPLSPAHDGGVPVDGVEAVNAGDEAGTVFGWELFPCQVACPRRNAGMEMQNIRPDGLKQGAEGPDAEESGDAFLPIGIRMWREPSFSRRGTRRPPPETTIFSTPREERPLPSSITTCSTPPDSMEGTRCTIFIRRGAEGKIWRGCSLLHGLLPEAGNREPSGGSSVFSSHCIQ